MRHAIFNLFGIIYGVIIKYVIAFGRIESIEKNFFIIIFIFLLENFGYFYRKVCRYTYENISKLRKYNIMKIYVYVYK